MNTHDNILSFEAIASYGSGNEGRKALARGEGRSGTRAAPRGAVTSINRRISALPQKDRERLRKTLATKKNPTNKQIAAALREVNRINRAKAQREIKALRRPANPSLLRERARMRAAGRTARAIPRMTTRGTIYPGTTQ